jgi:ABC-2 type transport system permease protein
MTSSRFYFSRGIWRQALRQHGWIGILYLIGLLFAVPMQLIMADGRYQEPRTLDDLFASPLEAQLFFLVTIPIAAAVFIFRYMQGRASSDLIHSLPIRRESLFVSHFMSGICLLLIPIWLTAIVTALIQPIVSSSHVYSLSDVVSWGVIVSIVTLLFYSFAVFVGVCLGQSILQAVVTYILLILPAGLIMMINYHFDTYLYGYVDMGWGGVRAAYWSPLVHLTEIQSSPYSWRELAIYLGLIVLFIIVAFLLYRQRHAERATQAIAFTYFNPLFQLGVMLCAMLVTGSYFSQMKHQLGWTIAGYLIGAVVGYTLSEMVIRKTWYILNRKVPIVLLAYTAALGLALYISGSNLTGYETRIPAVESIESVYFGDDVLYGARNYDIRMADDPTYIQGVRRLHEKIVQFGPDVELLREQDPLQRMFPVGIQYRLTNGSLMARHYWMPENLIQNELRPVMEAAAYKRSRFNLHLLEEKIDRISLQGWSSPVGIGITDPVEIDEFTQILKREIENMAYEDIVNDFHWATIEMLFKDNRIYSPFAWSRSFKELEAWLERKGIANSIRLTPDHVSHAEIVRLQGRDDSPIYRSPADRYRMLADKSQPVIIQDKRVIGELLERMQDFNGRESGYFIKLEQVEGNPHYFWIAEQELVLP